MKEFIRRCRCDGSRGFLRPFGAFLGLSKKIKEASQMKKFRMIFMSLFLILFIPFSAAAEDDTLGIYVGAFGGVAIPADMNTNITDKAAGLTINQDTYLNMGWLAGIKVGYLTPFVKRILAVELEYNHIENGFDSGKTYQVLGVPLNFDSKVRIDAVMFDLIGRYPEGKLHPYVGGGAGYAYLRIDNISASFAGINVLNASSGSDSVLAYQVLAGLSADITENWFTGLGYKFFRAGKASYGMPITSPFFPGSHGGSIDADYTSQNIVVTIGYLY